MDVAADLGTDVGALLGVPVRAGRPRTCGPTGETWRVELADGRVVFAKRRLEAPAGFFAAEVAGLRWLAEAPGGPPVPEVLGHDDSLLVLPWVPPGTPTDAAADGVGRALAHLHAAGAPAFGADRVGFVGAAPLDNRPTPDWPEFYADRRIRPYLRILRDRTELDRADAATADRFVDRLASFAGPAEPPARIHGDLWSGNVLWGADGRAWLVDPAAHGGHRETDLAMLALFGVDRLGRVLAAYDETAPLAAGWRERVALHQVHPLLVHAVLFGGGYLAAALAAIRRYQR